MVMGAKASPVYFPLLIILDKSYFNQFDISVYDKFAFEKFCILA